MIYAVIKFLVRLYFRIMYNLHFEGRKNIPKGTTVVEEQAFMDSLKGYMYVYMPYGAKTIKSKAFANTGIEWIGLPSTLTYIAPDAFAGSSVTIECPAGSPTEAWARANGIPTVNP